MMYPAGLLRFLLGVAVTGDISCNVNIWLHTQEFMMISRRAFTLPALASRRVGDVNIVFVGSRGVLRRCDRELWRHSVAMSNKKAVLLRELVC
jgi:hypothetical protein